MQNIKQQFCTAVVLLFFGVLCVRADVSEKTLDELLSLSGLNQQVSTLPSVFMSGAEQAKRQGTPISDEVYTVLTDTLKSNVRSEDILLTIRQDIKASLSQSEVDRLLGWFSSELGKKITAEEESSGAPDAFVEIMAQQEQLLKNERITFVKQVNETLGSVDLVMELHTHTGVAIMYAVLLARDPQQVFELDKLQSFMIAESAKAKPEIEKVTFAANVYAYRNISQKQLTEYKKFLDSEDAMKFNSTVISSLKNSLKLAINHWADDLSVTLQKKLNPKTTN